MEKKDKKEEEEETKKEEEGVIGAVYEDPTEDNIKELCDKGKSKEEKKRD